MNPRMTALLAGALVVLGGIAFFMQKQHEEAKLPPSGKLFPTVEIDQLDGIDIEKQSVETKLAKRDGVWIVLNEDEKPADPKLVEDLLTDIDQLTNTDLVSTNPDNHTVYEVGETGVNVTLRQNGKDVAAFVVGKPGPDYKSSYIRPLNKDETYRVPVYLRTKVDRGGQPWRNKTLLNISQDDIASYRTTDADGSVSFERSTGVWRSTEPFAGTVELTDVMGMVLNSIAKIVASGFADSVDVATTGLEPPVRKLEIHTVDGKDHVIEIGNENPSRQTYTRVEGQEQIYLVPVGRWNTVFRKAEDIAKPDPEPGSEGEGGTGVETSESDSGSS